MVDLLTKKGSYAFGAWVEGQAYSNASECQACSPILPPRTPYRERAGAVEAAMVKYLLEAKKFIEYARAAYSAEARDQDLDMAEWCITRAIEEAGHKPPQQTAAKPAGQAAAKPC